MRAGLRGPVTLLAALVAAACGGSSTAPTPSVQGNWNYTASNVAGSGVGSSVVCQVGDVTLSLAQSGNTIRGGMLGGFLVCQGSDDSDIVNFWEQVTYDWLDYLGLSLADGTITGDNVSFDVDVDSVEDVAGNTWSQTGTLSGASMSGTVTIMVALSGGGTDTLTGKWVATKQK